MRRFVNTENPESGADHFETTDSLAAWLEREGYPDGSTVTEADRQRAVDVRSALRELALGNHARSDDAHGHDAHARADGAPDKAEVGRTGSEHESERGVRPAAAWALARLDVVAADRPVVIRLTPAPHLLPTTSGVDGVLASLLAIVHDAMVEGSWGRMKACRNHHCRWVFYDHSKNRSGSWCSTAACGSRLKVRAYRARKRALSRPEGDH